jgi:hypothetical protein
LCRFDCLSMEKASHGWDTDQTWMIIFDFVLFVWFAFTGREQLPYMSKQSVLRFDPASLQ